MILNLLKSKVFYAVQDTAHNTCECSPPTVTTEDLEILPYLLNICLNPWMLLRQPYKRTFVCDD